MSSKSRNRRTDKVDRKKNRTTASQNRGRFDKPYVAEEYPQDVESLTKLMKEKTEAITTSIKSSYDQHVVDLNNHFPVADAKITDLLKIIKTTKNHIESVVSNPFDDVIEHGNEKDLFDFMETRNPELYFKPISLRTQSSLQMFLEKSIPFIKAGNEHISEWISMALMDVNEVDESVITKIMSEADKQESKKWKLISLVAHSKLKQ